MDASNSFLTSGGATNATLAGPNINQSTALSIAAVWAAVNTYTNTIGSLDFYIAEREEKGGWRPAVDHPSYDVVHSRPNDKSTSMRLRQAVIGHACTLGNGYLEILWDRRGRHVQGLELMDPRDTTPIVKGGDVFYKQGYGGHEIPASDVVHIAGFGWDGLKGYSPIAIQRDTLSIGAAQRTYQAALFGNGLGIKGHYEIPQKMTTVQKSEFRDNVNRVHQGANNAGNFGIVDNGGKWVNTAFSPQDAELIEGCNFTVAEVARIWNLPPHKLGLLEHANFATIEEMNIDFYQTSILPWLVAIEQEFNNKIFGPIERTRYAVRHDVSTLLRGNTAAQWAQEKEDLATGVRSINEIRIARGLNPLDVPQADYHFYPSNNLTAIETMDDQPPEPAVELDPDTATEDDPTAKSGEIEPDPTSRSIPAAQLEAASTAARGVLLDQVGKIVRQECQAARKASRRDSFDSWVAKFYQPNSQHASKSAEMTGPACQLVGATIGRSIDPVKLARSMADDSRERLRGLVVCVPPDEMRGAVERVCSDWEANRAVSVVDNLIVGGVQ